MQVTSGAVAGAALNTNQISRFQLLPDGHVDFGQMPKIHIVGSAADTNHNTLAKTFLRKRCTLPSSTNNRTVNRAIDPHTSLYSFLCNYQYKCLRTFQRMYLCNRQHNFPRSHWHTSSYRFLCRCRYSCQYRCLYRCWYSRWRTT